MADDPYDDVPGESGVRRRTIRRSRAMTPDEEDEDAASRTRSRLFAAGSEKQARHGAPADDEREDDNYGAGRDTRDEVSRGPHVRKVLTFKGKSVAVGLRWMIPTYSGDVQDFAIENAEDHDTGERSDLWCFKQDEGDPQVGLGSTAEGQKPRMPALAAEVASALAAEWCGLFVIDETYYLLAARMGTIDPETDIAFVDIDDAVKAFKDFCGRGFSKYYVSGELKDRSFGIGDIEEIDLERVIKRFSIKLREMSATGAIVRRLTLPAIILATMAIILFIYPDALTGIGRMLGFGKPPPPKMTVVPPMPWTGQPHADETLKRCLAALSVVPREAGGWVGDTAKCDGRQVRIDMKRKGSVTDAAPPVSWIWDWVKSQPHLIATDGSDLGAPGITAMKPAAVTIAWEMPKSKNRWHDRDRPDTDTVLVERDLWFAAENRFEAVTIAKGTNLAGSSTKRVQIASTSSMAGRYVEDLRKSTMTVSEVTRDYATDVVKIDARIHGFTRFPGDPKLITRTPDPAKLEVGPIPAPEK